MVRDERTANGGSDLFPTPARHLISRLHLLLDRPVVLGIVAVLVSILCCRALAQNGIISEVKAHRSAAVTGVSQHRSSTHSEEVPLLFLTLLGLASLALSQTRPSTEAKPRPANLAQAKKASTGKSCLDVRGQDAAEFESISTTSCASSR